MDQDYNSARHQSLLMNSFYEQTIYIVLPTARTHSRKEEERTEAFGSMEARSGLKAKRPAKAITL